MSRSPGSTPDRPEAWDLTHDTERYRQMLDALSALGEALVITEAGKVLYCNEAYERLTGYTFAEMEERANLIELAPPELQEDLTRRLADRLAHPGREEHPAESQLVTKDGRLVDCEFSIRMLASESPGRIMALVHDVSARKAAERALQDSERRMRAVVESVTDAIISFNDSGIILSLNPAAERMFGVEETAALGTLMRSLVADADVEDFSMRLARVLLQEEVAGGNPREVLGRRFDGGTFPMECVITSMQVAEGRLFLASMRDISERKAQTEALEYQALHDSLTGLPNRTLFGDRIRQMVLMAQRRGTSFPLLLFDLDRFKDINDSLGHEAGDRLLEALAKRLAGVLRESDTIARLGGDEFAVLPDGMPSAEDAEAAARKILHALEAPFDVGGAEILTSASIGISVYPEHGDDAAALIRRADVAMYAAKRASSGFAFYAPDQDRHAANRLSTLSELRGAIASGELVLHYQPKVSLVQRTTVGLEALVRWQHPRDGLLYPDRFIPLAEQSELIRPLSQWVLRSAVEQLGAWNKQGLVMRVAVNLSTRNLHDRELPAQLSDMLIANRVSPAQLMVEITESAAMDPEAVESLPRITGLGVKLAIDDFGTGYSSLAYLKRLPVAELKIDRSFVTSLDTDADDAAIVIPMIALGHNLGLWVVAEGVENENAQRILLENGCDFAQGYLFSRPMPAGDIPAWLRDSGWPPAVD